MRCRKSKLKLDIPCGPQTPLSQTPKNSFKRWPSPRNDLVVSNKLFQGPFIPLLWILFGQTGYPIKFFTYKWKSTDFPFLSYFRHQIQPLSSIWGHFLTFQRVCSIEFRKYYEKTLEMSSQLFVTWFDVAGHQHLKRFFLAPWLLPWIYPWHLPCKLYSLVVPWVLPCWHPWVLPCHLDTLGVQCTLNILVPLIYQQFRSDFIIAALTPLLSPTLPRCLLFCLPPPYNLSSKKFWFKIKFKLSYSFGRLLGNQTVQGESESEIKSGHFRFYHAMRQYSTSTRLKCRAAPRRVWHFWWWQAGARHHLQRP